MSMAFEQQTRQKASQKDQAPQDSSTAVAKLRDATARALDGLIDHPRSHWRRRALKRIGRYFIPHKKQ